MIINVLDTGSTITLETITVTTNLTSDPVVTTVTYPAGTSYDSHVVSKGTFDGTTWTVSPLGAFDVETLELTVIIDDIAAFSAGTRTVTAEVAAVAGEEVVSNNMVEKEIFGVACTDISSCSTSDNFFTANLTGTGNRVHDGAGYDYTINDLRTFELNALRDFGSGVVRTAQFDLTTLTSQWLVETDDNADVRQSYISMDTAVEGNGMLFQNDFGYYGFADRRPAFGPGSRFPMGDEFLSVGELPGGRFGMLTVPRFLSHSKRYVTIDHTDSPYTINPETDQVIFVDNSSSSVVINFPSSTPTTASENPLTGTRTLPERMTYNNGTGTYFSTLDIRIIVLSDFTEGNDVTLEPNGAETISVSGEGPTANYQIVASTAPFIIDVFSDGNNLFAAKHSNNT